MAVGPFVISPPQLFLLLGLVAAALIAYGSERRTGTHVRKPLWGSLLIGLLAARLGYVLTHRAAFETQPWQALYLWQGGYSPLLGVLAAGVVLALASAPGSGYPPRRLFAPLVVGLTVWGGLGWLNNALTDSTEYPLPELRVERLGGESVSLASFSGQPVVLNLWASWCPPCRREMPMLKAAQQARPDLQFLFVNQSEGAPAVRHYLQAEQLEELRNVLLDPAGRVGRHFRTPALPATLFFNAAGQLADTHFGALTRAHLDEHLHALLGKQS